MEYIVPFKLEVLLPALLAKKTSSVSAANIARVAGRWANRVFRPRTRNSTKLRIEPCRDWEARGAVSPPPGRRRDDHRPIGGLSPVALRVERAQSAFRHPYVPRHARKIG